MENQITILWADDEIDLLKPQILFLEKKGYNVLTVSNGHDAIEECESYNDIDVVFLDESMPGLTGLDTLSRIKAFAPHLPVVMITKNEAENVMEEAIGAQITDYLIKPVNPNQILLTLKKIIDKKDLVKERTASDYRQEFGEIFSRINSGLNYIEWSDVYRKIINWELKLDSSESEAMTDILSTQKSEANGEFSKFVERNYLDWLYDETDAAPILSHNLMREKVFDEVGAGKKTVFLLLDNLRFDQWKIIEPVVTEYYRVEEEDFFYSILPTATQYSRNSIFSGLMPSEIQEYYPDWWKNDNEKGGKNLFEKELLLEQVRRTFKNPVKTDYVKVIHAHQAKELESNILNLMNNDLSCIVYNFIDMLSHARTEMDVLKQLAGDERAYRSLTKSWFVHSPLWSALKILAEKDITLIITTDHGTIRVRQPSRVVGDRETTTNLRYKVGKNLQFERKDVLAVRNPKDALLPTPNVSSTFIFAKDDKFFLYPNNYNYYNNYYRDTFQHGGISLEEIICPIVRLSPK